MAANDNGRVPEKKTHAMTGHSLAAESVKPSSMCVNMTYDPGPLCDPGLAAAGRFVVEAGGLDEARTLLAEWERKFA